MSRATILVVDDEADFRENATEYLSERGYRVLAAANGESALATACESDLDAALLDIMMPDADGIELLERLRDLHPHLEAVMITGFASIERAIEAMRRGAFHYLEKPVRLAELELTLQRAVEKSRLARSNSLYRAQLLARRPQPPVVVAQSPAMLSLMEEVRRLASTGTSVLFEGETGTGKDLLARLLHASGPRHEQSFMVVDCGALAGPLIDSELFGHEKGAFTGASESRPGLLEAANGGTLLLDEVGELPPEAQVRLLRFLEQRAVRRLGATHERSVDVCVLAATHRDLAADVVDGRFREDLYHRLVVFRLRIPPLRERPEDIVPLAQHFASRPIGTAARSVLAAYCWPGNVRELMHTMERASVAAAASATDEIGPHHLGLPCDAAPDGPPVSLETAGRRHIQAVLEQLGGNRREAARVLGITERHLYRLLGGSRATPGG